MKKINSFVLIIAMLFTLCACSKADTESERIVETVVPEITDTAEEQPENNALEDISDDFVLISGGTFQMGSSEEEAWRSEDETLHTITVSDFSGG